MSKRRTPYTKLGIKRIGCVRCGAPGHATWSICADGNVPRVLCLECDIALNAMVLEWAGFKDRAQTMQRYEAQVGGPQ